MPETMLVTTPNVMPDVDRATRLLCTPAINALYPDDSYDDYPTMADTIITDITCDADRATRLLADPETHALYPDDSFAVFPAMAEAIIADLQAYIAHRQATDTDPAAAA